MKRNLAVLLAAIITASSFLPALAVERTDIQTEEVNEEATVYDEQSADVEITDTETSDKETSDTETSDTAATEAAAKDVEVADTAATEKAAVDVEVADVAATEATAADVEAAEVAEPVEETIDAESEAGNGEGTETAQDPGAVQGSLGESSPWLQEYEYAVTQMYDEEVINLTSYKGGMNLITVPGTAQLEGVTYPVVSEKAKYVWPEASSLTFDSGYIFPEDSSQFFEGMYNLNSVDLSSADTSRITRTGFMFAGCNSLYSIKMGDFGDPRTIEAGGMFSYCESLATLDLSCFSGYHVSSRTGMFGYCRSLRSLDLSGCDWSGAFSFYDGIFTECNNLEEMVVPVNVGEDVTIPVIMQDDEGNLYNTLPKSSSSIVLHKAEDSEWLEEYSYYVDYRSDKVSIYYYYGDDTEIVVPGKAIVENRLYPVEISGRVWGPEVERLSFGEGVYLSGYQPSIFSNMKGLKYLDLSNATFVNCENMDVLFKDCISLEEIILPASIGKDIDLPGLFIGDDGNRYFTVPGDLPYSITLNALEQDGWINDYTYSVSDNTIMLYTYKGESSDVVVPASAFIDGTEYSNIKVTRDCWADSDVKTLKLNNGVILPDYLEQFFSCNSHLESIDLSELGGISVNNINHMFNSCAALRVLDLSGLDISNCTAVEGVLNNCSALETLITPEEVTAEIDLPGAFTDEEGNVVTEMPIHVDHSVTLTRAEIDEWLLHYIFSVKNDRIVLKKCKDDYYETLYDGNLQIYTVPGSANIGTKRFDKIELSKRIWENIYVKELYLQSGVILPKDSSELFASSSGLEKIDFSNADFSEVENTKDMFWWCNNLTTIVTPKNVAVEVSLPGVYADANNEVYSCLPINAGESITLTKTALGNWLDDYIFFTEGDKIVLRRYIGNDVNIELPGSCQIGNKLYKRVVVTPRLWDGSQEHFSFGKGVEFPEDCTGMFDWLQCVKSIDLTNVDTSNVKTMKEMFARCSELTDLNLGGIDTSNVTDMEAMFFWDRKLTELDLSGLNTSKVTNMDSMFSYCDSLTSLDIGGLDTSNVKSINRIFERCSSLTALDLSSWDLRSLEKECSLSDGTIALIKTPVNVPVRVDLGARYLGTDGVIYSNLPINEARSMLLTWSSTSGDPTISGDPNVSGEPSVSGNPSVSGEPSVSGNPSVSGEPSVSGNPSVSGEPSVSGNPSVSGEPSVSGNPVEETITIISQPKDAAVRGGEQATFTVETEEGGLGYQWQWSADGITWKNCTAAGYNTNTFSFSMDTKYAGRSYRCIITSGTQTVYSDSATVTQISSSEITVQPVDSYVRIGEIASFHVETTGDEVSYQWQYSLNGSYWTNCTGSGYDTDTFGFEMKEKYAGRHYRCMVTADGETAISDAATAYLKNVPEITLQPEDATAPVGEIVAFHVEFSEDDPSYQWQWSADGTTWKNCTGSGFNTDTFSFVMKEKYAGRQYRCVIAADGETLTSDSATANLKLVPEITLQPEDVTAAPGETAVFHVEFSGETSSYQWQWSADGNAWKNCTGRGYNTDTFSFEMQERFEGRQYRCVITAEGEKYTSESARVSVTAENLITESPVDVTLKQGSIASFHVETSVNGLTYQWQWSKDGNTWKNCTGDGYSTDTFSFAAQTKFSGRRYRCMVKYGTKTEYSESALLTVTK